MENYRISFIVETDNKTENAYEALKPLEHHAEHLLDLDAYPCIKTVRELTVDQENELPDKIIRFAREQRADDDTVEEALIELLGWDPARAERYLLEFDIRISDS